jgi:hypothetical protein
MNFSLRLVLSVMSVMCGRNMVAGVKDGLYAYVRRTVIHISQSGQH